MKKTFFIDRKKIEIDTEKKSFWIEYNNWRKTTSGIWYGINKNGSCIAFENMVLTARQIRKLIKILYKIYHEKKINDRIYTSINDWKLYFENDDFVKLLF